MLCSFITQVRLTSAANSTVEDVIPSYSGGFGTAQFQPVVPVLHTRASGPKLSPKQKAAKGKGNAVPPAPAIAAGGRHLAAAAAEAPTPSDFGPLPGPSKNLKPPAQPVPWGSSANSSKAADYDLCGGLGETCPLQDQSQCKDEQYLLCANSGSVCTRLNRYMWECLPVNGSTKSAAGAPASASSTGKKAPPPSSADSTQTANSRVLLQEKSAQGVTAETAESPAQMSRILPSPNPPGGGVSTGSPSSEPSTAPTPSIYGPLPGPKPNLKVPPRQVPWSDSANISSVADFSQCGGMGETCPLANQTLCADTQYLTCMNTISSCVRLSKWYWQCLPKGDHSPLPKAATAEADAPAPAVQKGPGVGEFQQCGGRGDTCPLADRALCQDEQYLACANKTSECTRINEWYWQCRPVSARKITTAEAAKISPAGQPFAAPAPKGSISGAAVHSAQAPTGMPWALSAGSG